MPTLRMSVGLVVNPLTIGFAYIFMMPSRSAPSASGRSAAAVKPVWAWRPSVASKWTIAGSGESGFDFVARNQIAFEIASVGRIDALHDYIRLTHFEDFHFGCTGKAQGTFTQRTTGAFRHENPKAFDGIFDCVIPAPIEPENSKDQHFFYGVGFTGAGGHHGPGAGAFAHVVRGKHQAELRGFVLQAFLDGAFAAHVHRIQRAAQRQRRGLRKLFGHF